MLSARRRVSALPIAMPTITTPRAMPTSRSGCPNCSVMMNGAAAMKAYTAVVAQPPPTA